MTAVRRITLALVAASISSSVATLAQSPRTHLTIPFLANARSNALEFEGAECEADGDRLTCAFQQLFLTTSAVTPDTCLVTTNKYERVFQRDSPNHWTSREAPSGACGIVDEVTLQNDGGVKWTMELTKTVANKTASAACLARQAPTETFSWQNIRRSLPCRNIQPGGLIP